MFFSLPNLSSKAVEVCPTPWTFVATVSDTVRGKENKKARDTWINNPLTRHQCYTAFEGVNAGIRISKSRPTDEGNPPLKLHAFVADIDCPVSEDELKAGIGRLKELVPNYYERTLSGNARLVWLFEKPVSFPNERFATEFMRLALARTGFEQIAAALDKQAWETPNRLWTNSGEWRLIDDTIRIPFSLLQGWIVEVADKHVWRKDRGSIDIPLPVVWEELQKKFPGVAGTWPGEFLEGAQGPTFWIEGSASPKSAVVKPTGMFTFAAHATKPFYGWMDLLGKDFVEKHNAEQMGKAVQDIFHDGTSYWRKDGYGDWKAFSKEDVAMHLVVDRGLSSSRDAGAPSEVNRAISFIQNWQGVQGAAPFVFQISGAIVNNGNKFLNTFTGKTLQPSGEKGCWGPQGNFPFLSAYFDGFHSPKAVPERPLDYQLSWTHRFYSGCYNLCLESGQSQLFMGPTNVGKTLLNQAIIPMLVGGSAEAEAYLLGKSDFNSDLFKKAYWTIDDNSATVDATSHRKLSAMLKKMAANTTFQYHEKFRVPCRVDWLGRVGLTTNDDEESARIVPDLSISILDKLMIFLASSRPGVVFPPRAELLSILARELPFFARYLLDYKIPEHCRGTNRFGVVAYHEESLLRMAEQSSRSAGFSEILEDWRATFFADHPQTKVWSGTAFQLIRALNADEIASRTGILRSLTVNSVGGQLSTLKSKGCAWIDSEGGTSGRVWTIRRAAQVVTPSDPLPTGSKFSKPETQTSQT